MKKIEYSLIVRNKLKKLCKELIAKITRSIRDLELFELKGMAVSDIIIVEMFDEREDFMWKLFGVDTTSQETYLFWKE